MSIIDTHCHYNLEPLYSNWPEHWQTAQKQGVTKTIVVGTEPKSSQWAVEIAATNPHLYASLGLHPGYYDHLIDQGVVFDIEKDITELKTLLTKPRVIAIGETGLDYFHFDPTTSEVNATKIKTQKQAFIAQIELANTTQLPLIVHVRDKGDAAYVETLELIKAHYAFHKPFILHCASGPLSYIQEAIALGAYLGFDGNLTYKKNQLLLDIFTLTPPDKRLLETDAPFLPPEPFRGKPCEPWMISKTAEYVQTKLQADLDQIYTNTQVCFGLSR